MATGTSINRIDSQLDKVVEIPINIINCPKYPGCLIFLYNPVSINL